MRRTLTSLSGILLVFFLAGCPEGQDDPGPLTCPERPNCDRDLCEQVLIPASEFTMGSTSGPREGSYWESGDERPPHQVQLDAFCIDKYEVSLRRYEDCVDEGVCSPDGLEWEGREVQTVVNHYPVECNQDRESCFELAVNGKNYWQAQAYCDYVGGRLCSEAEWERAAGGPGPDKPIHPWGNEAPTTALVNLPSTGSGYVEPVDSHAAGQSAEGVYNMAGNVYEWVQDRYDLYEGTDDGEALDNPVNLPDYGGAAVVGRGSCFFTEPEETVTERSVFSMEFDWG